MEIAGGPNEGRPQDARSTLADIARESGVSKATVSLVLRNHPSIPERTRQRVLHAAEQLGYVYNRGAASLRSAQTHLIGLAVNDLTNPYFAEITAAIEDVLTTQNRIVIMSNTGESVERQSAFAASVREYNVDGLLLVPARGTDATFVDLLRSWRLPFVMVSRSVPGAETDLVQADHRAGTLAATEHLVGLGHRRIGFIGLNTDISTGRERLEGYQLALARSGIEYEPQLVLSGPATRDEGMAQLFALLDLPEPPTAAVCFNDVVAFGAMLGLRARNLTPGADFSIFGFDDIAEATLWRPALTSVSVPRKLIGQTAAELLLRRIGQIDAPAKVVLLPTELVVRDTTSRPALRGRRARRR
ncbi:LacI family DNA-binding transcriptional regulator [Methylobacterium nodulans]|uniref:Transcriptional regulator, LacI family n=1 Tax=Methylobacterium nodulans (strain LMG 21967 / CNCM I-2342 / ORS 2060) TaxID=460265 RepID=B8IX65_METNO|nr:LacI family DNA-binding transcriptional regulator [Methylobacterium nodulans]ACL63106.1 transcriptional regulator, LacI family [Methylobacterium nodulans ORS 2060]